MFCSWNNEKRECLVDKGIVRIESRDILDRSADRADYFDSCSKNGNYTNSRNVTEAFNVLEVLRRPRDSNYNSRKCARGSKVQCLRIREIIVEVRRFFILDDSQTLLKMYNINSSNFLEKLRAIKLNDETDASRRMDVNFTRVNEITRWNLRSWNDVLVPTRRTPLTKNLINELNTFVADLINWTNAWKMPEPVLTVNCGSTKHIFSWNSSKLVHSLHSTLNLLSFRPFIYVKSCNSFLSSLWFIVLPIRPRCSHINFHDCQPRYSKIIP